MKMSFLNHLNLIELAASAEEAMTRHGVVKDGNQPEVEQDRRKIDMFGIDAVRFFDIDGSES